MEHHLWSSDSCPAYLGICALLSSKPVPRCTAVRAEGGGLLTEEFEVKAHCAGYFERQYQADPPVVELVVRGVKIYIADSTINCEPPSKIFTPLQRFHILMPPELVFMIHSKSAYITNGCMTDLL